MFKQPALSKLPTFLQWVRENEMKDENFTHPILKILWGDAYKSITFQTDEYRYSIKFATQEEYLDACRKVLDAFQPKAEMSARVIYTADDGEVEVVWFHDKSQSDAERKYFRQTDWGIVHDEFYKPQEKPPSKKKPSAKLTKSAQDETPPF